MEWFKVAYGFPRGILYNSVKSDLHNKSHAQGLILPISHTWPKKTECLLFVNLKFRGLSHTEPQI